MSDIKIIKVPAIMTRISPTKDGGFSMGYHTNEVTDEVERSNVMSMYNTFGWLIFASEAIYEVPREAPTREAGVKTPSLRLRSVLYVLWAEKYSDQVFDVWYAQQIERIIERIKKELPPK